MFPFKEVTHSETGVKQRIPWDTAKANAKLQEFKRNAQGPLNERDISRARTAGADVPVGATVLATMVDDGKGNMAVDPIAAKVKHSGAELNDSYIPAYQEFCSRPQNDDGVEYPTVTYKPKQPQRLNSPVQEKEIESARRGPGRPPKQKMSFA